MKPLEKRTKKEILQEYKIAHDNSKIQLEKAVEAKTALKERTKKLEKTQAELMGYKEQIKKIEQTCLTILAVKHKDPHAFSPNSPHDTKDIPDCEEAQLLNYILKIISNTHLISDPCSLSYNEPDLFRQY